MVSKARIAKWKIYLCRSKEFGGLVQFLLMGAIYFNTDPGVMGLWFRSNQAIALPGLVVVMFVAAFVVGWLDTALGFRAEEQKNMSLNDPVHKEMLDLVRAIQENGIGTGHIDYGKVWNNMASTPRGKTQ